MASKLSQISIKGFKSIHSLEKFKLHNLNILIGGNGAGKSNFVEIFRMLRAMVEENFANYIVTKGGCDDFLFNGPKQTNQIEMDFHFGENAYSCILQPTATERLIIKEEKFLYRSICTSSARISLRVS